MIREHVRPAVVSLVLLTLITGVGYPLLITAAGNIFFKRQAEGSLIYKNGVAAGSELIGQPFNDPGYLWGRLSATAPVFNGGASSGSNYGPMNSALLDAVKARIQALKDADPENKSPVPVDLVTASGSGLDPHISPAGAYYQAARIARARGLHEDQVKAIIKENTQGRFLGLLGEPAVNVLKVNFALDEVRK